MDKTRCDLWYLMNLRGSSWFFGGCMFSLSLLLSYRGRLVEMGDPKWPPLGGSYFREFDERRQSHISKP